MQDKSGRSEQDDGASKSSVASRNAHHNIFVRPAKTTIENPAQASAVVMVSDTCPQSAAYGVVYVQAAVEPFCILPPHLFRQTTIGNTVIKV